MLALYKAIKVAMEQNRAQIWFVCPTYRQAEEIAWKMIFEIVPPVLIKTKHETKLKVTLINGAEISLKGADNEDSLRGVSLDFVIMDEYATMKENVWEEIIRPMLADREGKALFIGTPKGKNHFWKLWIRGLKKENGYSSYQFPSASNPYLKRSEIKHAKETTSEVYFKQEWEASFEDFTGLVFPEFSEKLHVIHPFDIPKWWETVGAIDPAMSGTTACLFGAVDESGKLYITGEYYEQNRRVSEVSDVIRGKCSKWYIDPASQIRNTARAGQLFSLFDEFADNGVYPITAENDVFAGINRVAEYLKTGRIKIFSTCKNLLVELERYHWSEERETISGISQPKPYKAFDHACDCLRYLVMSRPSQAQEPKPRSADRAMPLAIELLDTAPKDGWAEWTR